MEGTLVVASQTRRRVMAYVLCTLSIPLVAAAFLPSRLEAFLIEAPLAAGLYTLPAVYLTFGLLRNLRERPLSHRSVWFVGLILMCCWGGSLLMAGVLRLAGGRSGLETAALAFEVLAAIQCVGSWLAWVTSLFGRMRARFGARALFVDLLDAVIAVILTLAPVLVWVLPRLRGSAALWWLALPVGLWALSMPVFVLGLAMMLIRARRVTDGAEQEKLGLALALSSSVTSAVVVAYLMGHASWPVVAPIAPLPLTFALILIYPLYERRESVPLRDEAVLISSWGGIYLALEGILACLLLVVAVLKKEPTPAAVMLGLLCAVVLVSALRHQVTAKELEKLYSAAEKKALRRQELLKNLLRSVESERSQMLKELYKSSLRALGSISVLITGAYRVLPSSAARELTVVLEDMKRELSSASDKLLALAGVMGGHAPLPQALAEYLTSRMEAAGVNGTIAVEVDKELQLSWSDWVLILQVCEEFFNWRGSKGPVTSGVISVALESSERAVVLRMEARNTGTPQSLETFGTRLEDAVRVRGAHYATELHGESLLVTLTIPLGNEQPLPGRSPLRVLRGGKD